MSTQQIATKQEADHVRALLEQMKPQMALALPKHLTPERLLRVTMTAVQNVPRLLECNRTSLLAAVMTAAQLGLEPDGVLGQAYLVPFKGRVQFLVGYRGYLALARNSGEVASLQAHEVCVNDEFRYSYGLREDLHHVPASGDRGEITNFYAYAQFKDGGHVFEVLTKAQVDAIRDNSEGYKAFKSGAIKSTPWDSHYVEMGRKTAIRRIAKYLPLSVQRAAALDAAYDTGKHGTADDLGNIVIDGRAEEVQDPATTGTAAAQSKLDRLAGPQAEPKYTDESAIAAINSKRVAGTVETLWKEIVADYGLTGRDIPEVVHKVYLAKMASFGGQGKPDTGSAEIIAAIEKATTEDAVNEQLDLARELPEAERARILDVATKRLTALTGQSQ